jgi:subtilisin family serine protease
MRKLSVFMAIVLLLASSPTSFANDLRVSNDISVSFDIPFAPDRVIVKMANTSIARSRTPDLGIAYTEARMINPSKDVTRNIADSFTTRHMTGKQNDLFVLTLEKTGRAEVERAVRILNANPAVLRAYPDYYGELDSSGIRPNDYYNYDLWALEHIQLPEVWEITTGSKDVVVGVIDTGIFANHEDLADNIWVNPDVGNCCDLGDDFHGYNFAGLRNSEGQFIPVGGTPVDVDHFGGHGTHVAGTIGAVGNNNVGVTGVNWNVSLAWLGVCVFLSMGIGDFGEARPVLSAVIDAVNYAEEHNIPILNGSLGFGPSVEIQDLYNAINNYSGLYIATAGNNGINNDVFPRYPGSFDLPNIIAVGNSTEEDNKFIDIRNGADHGSSYGANTVHLFAPGTNITSARNRYSDGWYRLGSATSMAAPHVAGVAALIKSIRPDYTAAQIKAAILDNLDIPDCTHCPNFCALTNLNCLPCLGCICNKSITGGRLNAYRAVKSAVILYGDVDDDGVIDAADITLLRRYIAANDKTIFLQQNPRFNIANARVFGQANAYPTAADVALLRQYIAGFDVTLGPQQGGMMMARGNTGLTFTIGEIIPDTNGYSYAEVEVRVENNPGIASISDMEIMLDSAHLEWDMRSGLPFDITDSIFGAESFIFPGSPSMFGTDFAVINIAPGLENLFDVTDDGLLITLKIKVKDGAVPDGTSIMLTVIAVHNLENDAVEFGIENVMNW